MKHLMKGIRIAAYIAEIIVAGSTIVELVENELIRSIVAGVNVNLPQVKLIQAM